MLSRFSPLRRWLAGLCVALGLAAIAADSTSTTPSAAAPAPAAPPKVPLGSAVFDWSKLAVQTTPTGERRELFNAPTATFANCRCHVTTLRPGIAAHAPHRHPDEEIIVVKEGTIEVTINGAAQTAGAGSVFFFASNDLHGMRNVGDTVASYHVFRIVTQATPPPNTAPAPAVTMPAPPK